MNKGAGIYYYCVTNVLPSSGFSHTTQTRNQEGGGRFVTQSYYRMDDEAGGESKSYGKRD